MKGKLKQHYYFLAIFIGLMLFLGIYAFTYTKLQVKLMPLIVCGIALGLAVNELRKELTNHKKKECDDDTDYVQLKDDTDTNRQSDLRIYTIGFIWTIGLVLAIYLVGFLISTPLFIILYLMTHGRRSWSSVLIAVIVGAVLFTVSYFLQLEMFPGILFGGIV